ncbi:hypothetical protein BIW11_04012 [Tropilaelaps mercedesae]|uniref:Uncharacterized protein n=1 Tax=Tropilaelaps mercedesae TaxID=418985 RepID=A0A1V9XCD4_9ACAR|nr:hypothetical protein BIW11_04012 [Tropilaelaps mercedesae]
MAPLAQDDPSFNATGSFLNDVKFRGQSIRKAQSCRSSSQFHVPAARTPLATSSVSHHRKFRALQPYRATRLAPVRRPWMAPGGAKRRPADTNTPMRMDCSVGSCTVPSVQSTTPTPSFTHLPAQLTNRFSAAHLKRLGQKLVDSKVPNEKQLSDSAISLLSPLDNSVALSTFLAAACGGWFAVLSVALSLRCPNQVAPANAVLLCYQRPRRGRCRRIVNSDEFRLCGQHRSTMPPHKINPVAHSCQHTKEGAIPHMHGMSRLVFCISGAEGLDRGPQKEEGNSAGSPANSTADPTTQIHTSTPLGKGIPNVVTVVYLVPPSAEGKSS